MVTREDLESYLIRMDAEFEEVDDGMFLVRPKTAAHRSWSTTRTRCWWSA